MREAGKFKIIDPHLLFYIFHKNFQIKLLSGAKNLKLNDFPGSQREGSSFSLEAHNFHSDIHPENPHFFVKE